MMKIKLLMSAMIVLAFSVLALHAETSIDKAKAKIILTKTNRALGVAHMTVKRTQKFTGKLGKAVRHARFAKKLYLSGNYDKSAYHSLYARKLAIEIMKENGAKTGADFIFSADENTLISASPSPTALTQELSEDSDTELKDEELMNGGLDVDVL